MTKMHFTRAAEIVNNIRLGGFTGPLPKWAQEEPGVYLDTIEVSSWERGNLDPNYIRAVWTAEAFIILVREYNPRFNEQKFLQACGLAEPTVKVRKS